VLSAFSLPFIARARAKKAGADFEVEPKGAPAPATAGDVVADKPVTPPK
jgi:hypothetical protein